MRTELSAQVVRREFGLMQAGQEGLLTSSSSVLRCVESLLELVQFFDPLAGLILSWVEPLLYELNAIGEGLTV